MDKVEIMRIEGTFMVKSYGLILTPSFELLPNGKWEDINEVITIQKPDGSKIEANGLFSVAHMNIKDPSVSISKRWPILLSLKGISKEEVPIGSIVLGTQETKASIGDEIA